LVEGGIKLFEKKGKEKDSALTPFEGKRGEFIEASAYDLWTDMNRLFDRFRKKFDDLFWGPEGSGVIGIYEGTRRPPTDVIDLGDKYEMHVEMPGVPKENINIEVTPTGVEISAAHEVKEEEKGKNWLRRERRSMNYYRSLDLPDELKTEDVEAEMKNGVLTIKLPKVEPKPRYKAKKIKIK
jgi:HSP20 family protein